MFEHDVLCFKLLALLVWFVCFAWLGVAGKLSVQPWLFPTFAAHAPDAAAFWWVCTMLSLWLAAFAWPCALDALLQLYSTRFSAGLVMSSAHFTAGSRGSGPVGSPDHDHDIDHDLNIDHDHDPDHGPNHDPNLDCDLDHDPDHVWDLAPAPGGRWWLPFRKERLAAWLCAPETTHTEKLAQHLLLGKRALWICTVGDWDWIDHSRWSHVLPAAPVLCQKPGAAAEHRDPAFNMMGVPTSMEPSLPAALVVKDD
jgi:hypothetical protein